MGKTYEALKRAGKEHQENLIALTENPALPPASKTDDTFYYPVPSTTSLTIPTPGASYLDQYEVIKSNLFSKYGVEKLKTIVFTSTARGDGTSTTAFNFAASLARDTWRSVLLIDADIRRPCLHKIFNLDRDATGVQDIFATNEFMEFQPAKVTDNFYVHTSGLFGAHAVGLFETEKFNTFLNLMQLRFDFTIFDCPCVSAFPETLIIAKKVNGVVLVINCGKTKQQVAIRAKKDLVEAGANLLGVVLNNRRYYIPEWLYKRT